MKQAILASGLMLLTAVAARADVKMTQTVSGKGMMGIGGNSTSTTYIKGLRMRTDTASGDTVRSMIFDVEHQKIYMFDSKKKEVDVWDMADFGQQTGTMIDASAMKGSLKPNGQTKVIAGKTATGYDMNISMPTRMGDAKNGMDMLVTLSGPTWIVKGAPGTADFQKFYLAAAERGFIFTDPRAAKGQSGQAKAITAMYKEMAATGGVPYETTMDIKLGGDGPMAAMMSKMGGISMTNTVQTIEAGPLADDLFAPPAGYKLSPKK
jgi:hypothetical protein